MESTPIEQPECWQLIPGFPGYEVSSHGCVRAAATRRVRKPFVRSTGYEAHYIKDGAGKLRCVLAHAVVLMAFVGPRPAGCVGRHLDGNTANNRLGNLAWGTHLENSADARRHGRLPIGSKNTAAKLDEAKVLAIRQSTARQADLARQYGVAPITIKAIRERRTWSHV